MKRIRLFTTITLVANSAFEVGVGGLMFVSPAAVFPGAGPQAAAVARTLAAAAVAAGALSLAVLLAGESGRLFRAVLWTLAVFHVALAVVHGVNAASHFTVIAAPICHAFLALMFVLALLIDGRAQPERQT